MAFSPDGKRIASGSDDKLVKVWDVQTGQQTLSLKGHTGYVWSVAFSPDGKRIASASYDQTVKVWDTHTGQEVLTLKGHTDFVSSVAFSPDGKRIASGSADQTVKVWDAHTGELALTLKEHTGPVFSVAFSPDGKRIASASGDKTVKVCDAQTGQQALSLRGASGRVAFSPDSKRIASGVTVWDAQTGQQQFSLTGHTSLVYSVAFSPDGKRIASGSGDGAVKVWDAQTGLQTLSIKGHTSTVESVAFSSDGKRIASAGGTRDQTVKVWEAQTSQEALEEARRWVEPDFAWHAAEARASEAAGQWFAAAFHLGRLLPSRPWDAELHARRVYALLRSGQPMRAAISHVQALLLNPSARFWPHNPKAAARAGKAANAGNWPRAAAEFRLAVHQPGAPVAVWNDLLLVQQAARQQAAYRQSLAELLAIHEKTADAKTADAVAWCARIAPCDRASAQRAVRIAERLVKLKRAWVHLETLGVTLCRTGRFAEAVKTLQESIKLQGKGGGVHSWLFLAMAHKQLEHHDQARKWFDKFEDWYGKQQLKEWRRKVEWRLLQQEAKDLVNTMPHVAPGN